MPDARKRWLLAVAGVVVSLGLAAPAAAQEQVPEDNSSIDQYAESLPSSEGGRSPGVGRKAPERSLPASVQRRLPGGTAGDLQRRIATDTSLGAPAQASGGAGVGSNGSGGSSSGSAGGSELGEGRGAGAEKVDDPSLAATVGNALFGSSGLWPLLVIMAAVLGGGLLFLRHHRDA